MRPIRYTFADLWLPALYAAGVVFVGGAFGMALFIRSRETVLFLGMVLLAGGIVALATHRKVETLKRLNAERTGLLQLTFHQLGAPLTIFKWSAEMLREAKAEGAIAESIDEHLAYMDEGIARMSGIIDALCEAEKIEEGTIECHPEDVSIIRMAEKAAERAQPCLTAGGKTLRKNIAGDLTVRADPAMVIDVLGKLLQNACDYSPDGSEIELRVTVERGMARVVVSDKGDGISPQDLPHVTEKYVRGHHAYLRKPDGKGLGLYTARGMIELTGGTMWIRSSEGKGTNVFFTLPLA